MAQLIPERSQGNFTATLSIPQSAARHVKVALTSPTFPTDATEAFACLLEASFDGGQTWANWAQIGWPGGMAGGQGGQPVGKGGAIWNGLPYVTVSFDGSAREARLTCLTWVNGVANVPFVWGLTADVIP